MIAAFLLLALVLPAAAQSDAEYLLQVNKIIGSNLGSQINGSFKLGVHGDMSQVKSVEYRIDGQLIGNASESPFTLVFKTTDYASGNRQLSALVTTTDGRKIETPTRTFNFISTDESGELIGKILVPIFGIIFAVVAVMMLLQFVVMRNRPLAHLEAGAPRDYGVKGGTICGHCKRPYAFHWWAFNLMPTMRFDRCDYCGKWGVQHSYPLDALRAAERQEKAAIVQSAAPVAEKSEEEKLKEMMDQTKYSGQ